MILATASLTYQTSGIIASAPIRSAMSFHCPRVPRPISACSRLSVLRLSLVSLRPVAGGCAGQFPVRLDTGQNEISAYRISTTTGSLSPLSPATIATTSYPTSMAIRSDDSWLFVTNLTQANLSQYAITPSSGGSTPQTPVQTDNFPWGIAVK